MQLTEEIRRVADEQLAPTIAGFWATPQRHMVLPSLEILARLILPPIPSPSSNIPDIPEAKDESVSLGSGERTRTISPMAKRDTDTRQTGETVQQGPDAGLAGRVGELTISTTASTPEGNMGSQVPERHPYGEEMRALRVVLGRKDNVSWVSDPVVHLVSTLHDSWRVAIAMVLAISEQMSKGSNLRRAG